MAKRSREENFALFGENNAKEAKGLDILCGALQKQGRLLFRRTAEGAHADFCVWPSGMEKRALGCQLKTTSGSRLINGVPYYVFSKTRGYAGLLLVLVALTEPEPLLWLCNASDVASASIAIPVQQKNRSRFTWGDSRTELGDLSTVMVAQSRHPNITLQPVDILVKPKSPNHLKEYEAQQRLEAALPLEYVPSAIEGQAYDYLVDGDRWQMKLAYYNSKTDYFSCAVHKHSSGEKQQYAATDFDYLALQLPKHEVLGGKNMLYLIPTKILKQRDLVGRCDISSSTVYMFPHRPKRGALSWTEHYAIDLSTQRTALAGYYRVVQDMEGGLTT